VSGRHRGVLLLPRDAKVAGRFGARARSGEKVPQLWQRFGEGTAVWEVVGCEVMQPRIAEECVGSREGNKRPRKLETSRRGN
jgi:hypothetical protein